MSPQQAITTSGSTPWSLLAHSQMPMPAVQCIDRRVHVSHCGGGMLAGDHDVDVMAAAQAVVHDGEEAVGVGGEIDADDIGLLVDDVIDEARDPGG